MSRDEYFRVFISVGMILRPTIDADELQKIIKEEFEADTSDNKSLFVTEEEQKSQAEAEMNQNANGGGQGAMPKTYEYID